jgi:hypothetical protein
MLSRIHKILHDWRDPPVRVAVPFEGDTDRNHHGAKSSIPVAVLHCYQNINSEPSLFKFCIRSYEGTFPNVLRYGIMRIGYRCLPPSSRRHRYFDVAVGLAWSHDTESYAGGSVATGRVSHAGEVKGNDPDKKGHLGVPGFGLTLP